MKKCLFVLALILLTACQDNSGISTQDKNAGSPDKTSYKIYSELMGRILGQGVANNVDMGLRKGTINPYRKGFPGYQHKALAACLVWDTDAVLASSKYWHSSGSSDWSYAAFNALDKCSKTAQARDLDCKCQLVDHDDVNVLEVPYDFRKAYESLPENKSGFIALGDSGGGSQSSDEIRYLEAPVEPITSLLTVRYRPIHKAPRIKDETTVNVDENGKEKTSTEHKESTILVSKIGENLLYQTSYTAEGKDFTINMLMSEFGEVREVTVSGSDTAASGEVNQALQTFESTIKAYTVVYPREGVRTGDDLFADRGEVRMGSFDAWIYIKGEVQGLSHFRGRPSILVDLAGSYLVIGSNPKAYMDGWMLLDVETGMTTKMYTRIAMRFSDKANQFIVTATDEIRLPQLAPKQTADPSEKQYYLDLAWENLLEQRDVFPVMIKQVGRVGYVKSASLIGGKKCDAVFRYDETGQGDWEVTCTDGTRAVGVLQTLGRGKGSKGSGFDTDGNKIDFRIRHGIAE
ncbi:hypothetical protein GQF03_02560 [Sneathiella chungangensis]|uniref:Uncharacterized protein n=1 Tax=Sneathiella chungangensis TaxID=1418234 RepID=A0A845MBF7_9PROT|nr:hypothetical protein [Sneathiella chungangensis]MZR21205.1 hypothetical protein [Sneathiella chungangensis]